VIARLAVIARLVASGRLVAIGPRTVIARLVASGPRTVIARLVASGPLTVIGPRTVIARLAVIVRLVASGPLTVIGPLAAAGPARITPAGRAARARASHGGGRRSPGTTGIRTATRTSGAHLASLSSIRRVGVPAVRVGHARSSCRFLITSISRCSTARYAPNSGL
jgi:hypothetical protein